MNVIHLDKKTGFVSKNNFQIFDEKGIEFYSSSFTDNIKNGKIHKFNLPKGSFQILGNLIKLTEPVKFSPILLPPKERDFKPKVYKILFEPNKNKCTINHILGTITFDNAFKIAPKYILYDIYFHELGHNYYTTEKFADLYAAKKMLEVGFNPTQIGRSKLVTLSNNSFNRKEFIINRLKNI